MSSSIDHWISRLAKVELPVLSTSKQVLGRLQDDPKVSAGGIAAVVLTDPMMTLRLMRLANASRRGEFAQRITTAEHAVMLLGFSNVFSRLNEAPIIEELEDVPRLGLFKAATRACHSASVAREWALQRMDTSPEEVYIAALLYGMAEMALWIVEPEKMAQLTKLQHKQSGTEVEQHVLGCTLMELSHALAELWNMPPLIISAFKESITEGQGRSDSVMLANRIVRNAEAGWWQPKVLADIEDIATVRRLSVDETAAHVHRAAVNAARKYAFPGAVPVAAWLPLLEGEWPNDEVTVASHTNRFHEVMDEISRGAASESLTLSDLLTLIIRGMRDGIGLQRIVFALLTQDRNELKPRYVYGAEDASPLKAFQFDMRQRHLFSVLMAKQQAVWVSADNRARYEPVWNPKIDSVTSGYEFYAMSLSVHDKIVGLLYADRLEHGLDASGYEQFKQLSTQAAHGMARLSKPKAVTP